MTQTNLLELAKQGDPQAIAILMNRSLQPRGITANVNLQGNCLHVALEAEQVPNRQALTAFVQNGIGNLGIKSIQSIKVVGRQVGASVPAWMHEIILDAQTDGLAVEPAAAQPSPEANSLPPTLPPRPTPPPVPPFRPAAPPLVVGDAEDDVLSALSADLPVIPSDAAPDSSLDSLLADLPDLQSESQIESLELEDLGLDNLEFEEFDTDAIAPGSNADFGFPEDSELEEAIANDFGVSSSRSRGMDRGDNTFTNLDDLGLGALDDELDEFGQEAIAGDLDQFNQSDANLDSLEEFDFGDELSEGSSDLGSPQTASENINTDDLLASLDFEDGLDLEELDLTSDPDLASVDTLQPVPEAPPESRTPTDFERELNFADDLAIGSEATTDPLADFDLEDSFNLDSEDAFNLDSDSNALNTDPLSGEFDPLMDLGLEDEFNLDSELNIDARSSEFDPLAGLGLEDEFGLDNEEALNLDSELNTDPLSSEFDPLAGLGLEDEFTLDSEDEFNLDSNPNIDPLSSEVDPLAGLGLEDEFTLDSEDEFNPDSNPNIDPLSSEVDPLAGLGLEDEFGLDSEEALNLDSELNTDALSDEFLNDFKSEPNEASLDPLAALRFEDELDLELADQFTEGAESDPLTALELEEFQLENGLGESWNLDEDPISASWIVDDASAETSNVNPSTPSTDISTDALDPLAFEDEFGLVEEPSADPLALLPNAPPSYDAPDGDPMAALDFTDDLDLDGLDLDGLDLTGDLSDDALSDDALTDEELNVTDEDLNVATNLPDSSTQLSEADLTYANMSLSEADLSYSEASSFLEFDDLELQDDLGTVELVDSPDDDLPAELLVDDIAMPDETVPSGAMPGMAMPEMSASDEITLGLDSSLYDLDDYSTIYSEAESDAADEDETLDWMSDPAAESSVSTFSEGDENGARPWEPGTALEPTLESTPEPTLEGFTAIAPPDFYLETEPADSPLEPDVDAQTIELTDGYLLAESSRFLPDPQAQFSLDDEAELPELTNQRDVQADFAGEQEDFAVEQETVTRGQENDGLSSWDTFPTEVNAVSAPDYLDPDEATSLDQPLLVQNTDPLALSLEPTVDQNFGWATDEADRVVQVTSEPSPGDRSPSKSLVSSVLLFLIGWVALLIGYSLWSNLTAPSPAPLQPGVPQQSVPPVPPANPPVAPVAPPADQVVPPPEPLPGEVVPPVPPAN